MKMILLILIYLLGVVFSLGFWLEDFQGQELLRPVIISIFWPLCLDLITFYLGITAAKWMKRFRAENP